MLLPFCLSACPVISPTRCLRPEHPPGWISSVASAWISFLCFQPMPVSPGPSDSHVLAFATPPELVSAANPLPVPWTAAATPRRMTLDKSRPGSPALGRALETKSASPFPGLCDQLGHGCGSGRAHAGPARCAPQHPGHPWVLGWGACPRGQGLPGPFPGPAGHRLFCRAATGWGRAQSIPSAGQPHSPSSRRQLPGTRSGPDAAGPAPAPSPRCLLWPCCSCGPNMGCGNGGAGSLPGAGPDGPPAWAAALGKLELNGKAPCVGSTPLTWGLLKHPAALHPCPSAPHSPHPCPTQPPHPCLGQPCIPALCSTLCQSAGVRSVPSHLPVPAKPHGPGRPAAFLSPSPAQHGLHQAGAETQSRFCSQRCREMSCQRAERRGADRHRQPWEPSSRLVPGQGSRGPCGRASWAPRRRKGCAPPSDTGCVGNQMTRPSPRCHPPRAGSRLLTCCLSPRGSGSSAPPFQTQPGLSRAQAPPRVIAGWDTHATSPQRSVLAVLGAQEASSWFLQHPAHRAAPGCRGLGHPGCTSPPRTRGCPTSRPLWEGVLRPTAAGSPTRGRAGLSGDVGAEKGVRAGAGQLGKAAARGSLGLSPGLRLGSPLSPPA